MVTFELGYFYKNISCMLKVSYFVDMLQEFYKRFNQSEEEQAKEKLALTKQLTISNTRLERLNDIYLDGDISKDEYHAKKQNIEFEKHNLEQKISEFSENDKEFEIILEYLLKVASRIFFIYESSRIDKKRKILNLVFSNFWLNGQNLSYDIRKPFAMFVKRTNRLKNWAWRDSNSHAFALVPKTSVSTIPPHAHM